MDKQIEEAIRQVIKEEIGDLVSKELEVRLKPFLRIADEIRVAQDEIRKDIREDRKDIDAIKIGQATGNKQNQIIIENQNHQEDRVVEVVREEAEKIPKITEEEVKKSVEKLFESKPLLKRLLNRFTERR